MMMLRVMNSINYFSALKKNKIKSEFHIYEDVGHGIGPGNTPGNKNQKTAAKPG